MKVASIRHVERALAYVRGICPFEEICALCPELTEIEVLLALDELSRCGEIRLTRDTTGTYLVEPLREAPA